MRFLAVALLAFTGFAGAIDHGMADDWPMDRADAARSGFTAEPLPGKLSLAWKSVAVHSPRPAWPRDDRMQFDRAFRVVIADGRLFFGSSADGKVYALDAVTGEEKWTYFTDGPIRLAPAVWKDRVFVVSDDGYLYCLSAADGKLRYPKLRGGPADERVLGNGRITSRWPARGGPVVLDGIVYWAAGIWQSEKIYIRAVDAQTGKVLWTNDTSGGLYMPQPHGGANAHSGVTVQGLLIATAEQLFVPTGRAVPAAFSRETGEFQYYHLQKNGHRGGTSAIHAGPFLYNGGSAYQADSGELRSTIGAGSIAAFDGGILHSYTQGIRALTPIEKPAKDRRGKPITVPDHRELWKVEDIPGGTALIVAGNTAVATGGGSIAILDLETRQSAWSTEVDGIAYGLAAADGRLYVSTDKGVLYCFSETTDRSLEHARHLDDSPYDDNAVFAAAAEEIIRRSDITEGYCVDLGCGDGRLALELAKRTKLMIHAVDPNPDNVDVARRKLDAAGLYGSRVVVHRSAPTATNYPKFFANLVVCGRSVIDGTVVVPEDELARLQRPYGGVAVLGKPGALRVTKRGALEKAGDWTHLYSNAANTLCSTDEVKGPLKVLWFRDIDLELPQRHGRGPSPLFHDGRLFAEGLDGIRAVDAYNGRPLWHFEIEGVLEAYNSDHLMGTAGTGSNYCLAGDSVYVRHRDRCYRLHAATGEKLAEFTAPNHEDGKPTTWGYLACVDGILFGSLANEEHVVRHAYRPDNERMQRLFTESSVLFALDAETGKMLWRYEASESIRHNAIAIGDGRVFLVDRKLALDDLLARATRRGEKPKTPPAGHPTGKLVVLDAKTGERQWSSDDEIFATMLAYSEKFDMLLLAYQSTRFRLPSEVGGRLAVFRATDGYRVWDKKVKYNTRPLINDRSILAHGGSWDLLTGETRPFELQKSYGCGQLAGSKHLLLFRSATLGYLDLQRQAGVENFGGIRPGCWINALPVGGLVLVPDASAGCRCSYQNRSWVALQGSE